MQDDLLIGYLLKALEPSEMLAVERQLQADPGLRARLEQLEAMLEPLSELDEPIEPPAGLLGRTMDAIDAQRAHEADLPTMYSDEDADRGHEAFFESVAESALAPGTAAASGSRGRDSAGLSPTTPAASASGWSGWDVALSLSACLALCALLFPALYRTREQARNAQCQDQLRELGNQLLAFAMKADDGRFPSLDPSGREAFAGVYSVRLKGAGLLDEDRLVWCPSSPEDEVVPGVPEPEQLAQADPASVPRLQRIAGGRYAYNLGVLENNRYHAPRLQSRGDFALLSDFVNRQGQSTHPTSFNVLYEDGHVSSVPLHTVSWQSDHPFLNDAGRHEAGVTADDAVLGPSPAPPFVWVDQR